MQPASFSFDEAFSESACLNLLSLRGLTSESVWDYENGFYWFSEPSRLHKLLAHYELYQGILGLPGDVFELGVYKAASLIRFATFRNMLENDSARKIVGFDAFGVFPRDKVNCVHDQNFIDTFEAQSGDGLTRAEVLAIFERKGFRNMQLIQGNILVTLDSYLCQFPATRIALLHLDMDVREPTQHALGLLYERMVPDGLVVFDDYNAVTGATEAIDEFAARYRLKIQKNPYYGFPSFIRKPI